MTNRDQLTADEELLKRIETDSVCVSEIFRPGPYWLKRTENAAQQIRKFGLNDFRGFSNLIGSSFSDNATIDIRNEYSQGAKAILGWICMHLYPISHIFNAQVALSFSIYKQHIALKNQVANNSHLVRRLISSYKIPEDTTRGGCVDYSQIDGKRISNHYLNLLETHSNLGKYIDFSSAESFFEIGGGFGVNVHLLLENYKNIKKIVYLDIAPNLYVGTQYLKSFYGNSVRTYLETRHLESIEFKSNDELEIICILPHQIEKLKMNIDIFQNSHSFVEIPRKVVANYAEHINRIAKRCNSSIGLISYDCFDLNTTFHPDSLPGFFGKPFKKFESPTLWDATRTNYYYVL